MKVVAKKEKDSRATTYTVTIEIRVFGEVGHERDEEIALADRIEYVGNV